MLKNTIIEITEGRDKGKVFYVQEMPLKRLEKWCGRALVAMLGGDIPADIAHTAQVSSAAAFMQVFRGGLKALRWEDAEPLWDALLPCIYVLPKGREEAKIQLTDSNLEAHICDLTTIVRLRMAVLDCSLGFFIGGGR